MGHQEGADHARQIKNLQHDDRSGQYRSRNQYRKVNVSATNHGKEDVWVGMVTREDRTQTTAKDASLGTSWEQDTNTTTHMIPDTLRDTMRTEQGREETLTPEDSEWFQKDI